MTNTSLEGKVAIVCGSTQGIGMASAVELAYMGASIILVARNETALKAVMRELPKAESAQHTYLVADFSDPASLKAILDEWSAKGGKADILINNTGGPPGGALVSSDFSQIQSAIDLHLHCNHLLVQAVAPGMISANFGRIINVISTSVKIPIPGLGVSNTVRGAVASWAKTLAWELGSYGITVNNVLPGFTRTTRLESIIDQKCKSTGKTAEEVTAEMVKEVPALRFAKPQEVASAVAFLATPAAGYINGINLPVDGGRTGSL